MLGKVFLCIGTFIIAFICGMKVGQEGDKIERYEKQMDNIDD